MRKPLILMPSIIVYKIVFGVIKLPILFCKYFYKGMGVIGLFLFEAFLSICWLMYQIPKYFIKGIYVCLSVLVPKKSTKKTNKVKVNKTKTDKEIKNIEPNINEIDEKEFKRLRTLKLKEIKRIKANESKKTNVKNEKIQKDEKKKKNESYVNDNVKMEHSVFESKMLDFFQKLKKIPNKIKEKVNNNEFVKHSRNKNLMKKEALLINFDGEDAEKSDTKILYEYVAKNPEGKIVKDYFEAFSKVEVHSFLLSEGFEVYSIKTNKWIQMFHKNSNVNNTKFKTKDLSFFLTQLSTYIKAGIPLVDALRILEKQYKNKSYKRILKAVIYDITMGDNFSEALAKQNVAFPRLLINMIKTSEMTGELTEVLDDQAAYYDQTEKIRKQMISAMIYPTIVFVASIGVSIFIMLYVIPQFVEIYESMDASQIPKFTLVVLAISNFLKKYIVYILIGVLIFVILFVWAYKSIRAFRTICQWVAMKLPIIGNTIIYNEVAMFTKTFSSLLAHNVFITDSMEVLKKITNNEIYKMIIFDTITNLAKGDKISEAFKDNWAFPLPAYEMLVTGEKTGELPEMMAKVSDYYQTLHAESVARIKTVSEPLITIFLTVIVGILIMAIIVPMFSMYSTIQGT